MSLLRVSVSLRSALVLLACALGSTGCYDLSTSGPRPEDFARDSSSTDTQEQNQTEGRAASPTSEDDSRSLIEGLVVAPAASDTTALTDAETEALAVRKAKTQP